MRITTLRCLTVLAIALAGCHQHQMAQAPTTASSFSSGVSLQVSIDASARGHGLPSPISVGLSVRDEAGRSAQLVDGQLAVRDSDEVVLAQGAVPASGSGQARIELAWPQNAIFAHRLDIHLNVLRADGTVRIVEQTLVL
jgi:hypothetical protein